MTGITVSEMRIEVNEYLEKISSLKEKIKFCNDNNLEVFDENMFKIYKILYIIEKEEDHIKKCKIINDLINKTSK